MYTFAEQVNTAGNQIYLSTATLTKIADSYLHSYTGRMTYTVAGAKNKLPDLIKQAEAGVRVTITRRGVPVVEIVRKIEDAPRKRVFGVLGNKKIVIDPEWAQGQEDIDAWLAGDV